MIIIQTYRLETHFGANTRTEPFSTEWLREAVNKLMRDKRETLETEGADVSLFYNHDQDPRYTRIGYPLIIYHYIRGIFYITGINRGAVALELLAKHYQSPFTIDEVIFQCFRKEKTGDEYELGPAKKQHFYVLHQWLPMHHKNKKAFDKKDMVGKVIELNQRLEKHIAGELGKYLEINFEPLNAVITNISRVYHHPVIYKGYKYPAFDIVFTANVLLPKMITLGNNKALGFGRIEPV